MADKSELPWPDGEQVPPDLETAIGFVRWLSEENNRLKAAWLKRIKIENNCQKYLAERPCRFEICACALEMQSYIDDQASVAPEQTAGTDEQK